MTRFVAAVVSLLAGLTLLAGCSGQPAAAPPGPTASANAPVPPAVAGYTLNIPKLGVSSSLVPLGVNPDKTVQVPPVTSPQQAGLYENGPKPGDKGPAVILGHVNGGGQAGVFARLSELRAGDEVDVGRQDGSTAVFRVTRSVTVPKGDFPTSEVYSDTDSAELRLVTCGGDLDRTAHSYLSNVVVFATKVQ